MAWIESHQEIGRHPKTRRLARQLGVSVPAVVGHLHLLWHWCLDFAEDGDLSAIGWDEIADGAMWDGDARLFGQALIDAGWLDADEANDRVSVHDWDAYTGRIQAARETYREANRERQRRYRERQKTSPNGANGEPNALRDVTETLYNGPTVPNLTVTEPNQDEPTRAPAREAAAAAKCSDLVRLTAEILWAVGFIRDSQQEIEAKVRRSFALVPSFTPDDGPYLAERFAGWVPYRAEPPDDWYQPWLAWVRSEAKDAAAPRGSPVLAGVVEDTRPHPERELWVPYDQRPNYQP